jgi:hypothetical protein
MGIPYGTKLYVSLPNGEYRMCYKNHDMMNVTVKSDREAFENARVIPDGDVKTYGYAVRTLEVK